MSYMYRYMYSDGLGNASIPLALALGDAHALALVSKMIVTVDIMQMSTTYQC